MLPPGWRVEDIPDRVRSRRRRRGVAGAAGLAAAAAVVGMVVTFAPSVGGDDTAPALRPTVPLAGCTEEPSTCVDALERVPILPGMEGGMKTERLRGGETRIATTGSSSSTTVTILDAAQTEERELTGRAITLVDGTTARAVTVDDDTVRTWVAEEVPGVRPAVEITVEGSRSTVVTARAVKTVLDAIVGAGEEDPGRGCTLIPSSCDEATIRSWGERVGFSMPKGARFELFSWAEMAQGEYSGSDPSGPMMLTSGSYSTEGTRARVTIVVGPLDWFDEQGWDVDGRTKRVAGVKVTKESSRGTIFGDAVRTETWEVRPGEGHAGIRVGLTTGPDGEKTWTDDDVRELLALLLG